MTTTDTGALTERIAGTLWGHHGADGMRSILRPDCYVLAAAVLPIVAEEVRKAKAEALTKRWVCQVARSGYHNGASCRPDDAHNDRGCDYYYEASIRATEHETGDSDERR